jgi:hypothetical protein
VVVFWVASAQVDGTSNARGRGASMLRVRGCGGRTCRAPYAALGTVLSSRVSSAGPGPGPSKPVGIAAVSSSVCGCAAYVPKLHSPAAICRWLRLLVSREGSSVELRRAASLVR